MIKVGHKIMAILRLGRRSIIFPVCLSPPLFVEIPPWDASEADEIAATGAGVGAVQWAERQAHRRRMRRRRWPPSGMERGARRPEALAAGISKGDGQRGRNLRCVYETDLESPTFNLKNYYYYYSFEKKNCLAYRDSCDLEIKFRLVEILGEHIWCRDWVAITLLMLLYCWTWSRGRMQIQEKSY